MRANLKRHNRVYIHSSKHTYRPMSARVVAQVVYKLISIPFTSVYATVCYEQALLLGIVTCE